MNTFVNIVADVRRKTGAGNDVNNKQLTARILGRLGRLVEKLPPAKVIAQADLGNKPPFSNLPKNGLPPIFPPFSPKVIIRRHNKINMDEPPGSLFLNEEMFDLGSFWHLE